MPQGKHKSGRYRKVFVSTPGNLKVHFRESKPSKAVCGLCHKPLLGVPRERPAKMVNMAKTMKRPERPYGGVYCSNCTRNIHRAKARDVQ